MKFIYSLVVSLVLIFLVVLYHYSTTNIDKKYNDIAKLSEQLKYISISTQFQSKKYKEFAYE